MHNPTSFTRVVLWRFCLLALSLVLPFIALQCLIGALQPSPRLAYAAPIKVGLVTDMGTLRDKGFNYMSYQGLLRAETDFGVVGTVYTSTTNEEITINLAQCVSEGNLLCFTIGFYSGDYTYAAALVHPSTRFATLDYAFPDYGFTPNLRGLQFDVSPVAYLAGYLAGSMSQSHIVGDLGGMQIPSVTAFTEPFSNGAHCASPAAQSMLAYAGDFSNPDLGADMAQSMIASGADVIFAVAGPTGVGAVLTATQSGAWGIGVDTDFYDTIFDSGSTSGADKLLTSVTKRLDSGVYNTIRDLVQSNFTPGTIVYGLAEEGSSLAPYHEAQPSIPAGVQTRLDQLRQDLLYGLIDVNSSACISFTHVFLPITRR